MEFLQQLSSTVPANKQSRKEKGRFTPKVNAVQDIYSTYFFFVVSGCVEIQ